MNRREKLYSGVCFSEAKVGDRVKVHLNLGHKFRVHGLKTWSVKQSGLTTGHARAVRLSDVRFVVGKSASKKVREGGDKTVHAFAVGTLESVLLNDDFFEYCGDEVKYNPHCGMSSFCKYSPDVVGDVEVCGEQSVYTTPVSCADIAWLTPDWKVYAVGLK